MKVTDFVLRAGRVIITMIAALYLIVFAILTTAGRDYADYARHELPYLVVMLVAVTATWFVDLD